MTQQLKTLIAKFEALSPRERWIVFFAGLVLIYSVLITCLLEPVLTKRNQLRTEISQSQTQMSEMQQQLTTFSNNPVVDGNAANKIKVAELQISIQEKAKQIDAWSTVLLKPEAMPELLKGLLQQNAALSLVSMKTLAPRNILEKEKSVAQNSTDTSVPQLPTPSLALGQSAIYEHGMEVTLSGSYLDLLRYAEALESLKLKVLWNKVELKAKDYPESELTLTLYTLSLDKTWLSI